MRSEKKLLTREAIMYICEICYKESFTASEIFTCERKHEIELCEKETNHEFDFYYLKRYGGFTRTWIEIEAKCKCGKNTVFHNLDNIPKEGFKELFELCEKHLVKK